MTERIFTAHGVTKIYNSGAAEVRALFFKDQELSALDDTGLTAYRRQHVGFVFQFYNLIPSLTAYENVALVMEIAENPMSPGDALDLVGLKERMHHFPAELSGVNGLFSVSQTDVRLQRQFRSAAGTIA